MCQVKLRWLIVLHFVFAGVDHLFNCGWQSFFNFASALTRRFQALCKSNLVELNSLKLFQLSYVFVFFD